MIGSTVSHNRILEQLGSGEMSRQNGPLTPHNGVSGCRFADPADGGRRAS